MPPFSITPLQAPTTGFNGCHRIEGFRSRKGGDVEVAQDSPVTHPALRMWLSDKARFLTKNLGT
jgi:hypothetical protein